MDEIIREKNEPSKSVWKTLEEYKNGTAEPAKKLNHLEMGFVSRREFLEWMGGVSAVLGLSNCTRQPTEKILPYVKAPEYVVPGKPLFFASAVEAAGDVVGVLVESHMGRPTKIEGNPDHPASLGGTSSFVQASILDLYDPDRLRIPSYRGLPSTWDLFVKQVEEITAHQQLFQGDGLYVVTPRVYSPTLLSQLGRLKAKFPKLHWISYEPVHQDNSYAGSELALGQALDLNYDLSKVDVLVTIDSDFMGMGRGSVRYAKDFSKRRRDTAQRFLRYYSLESFPTITSNLADHRFKADPQDVGQLLLHLARKLGLPVQPSRELKSSENSWVSAVASDLSERRGRSLLIVGEWHAPAVHALVHSINGHLQNFGSTVLARSVPSSSHQRCERQLSQLIDDMEAGKVDNLFLIGTNLAYQATDSVRFVQALNKVKFKAYLASLNDETAVVVDWVLPKSHFLESWNDHQAYDGTLSCGQPLIAPLYQSRSAIEFVNLLLGKASESGYDTVRSVWKETVPNFNEKMWNKIVHDGTSSVSLSRTVPVAVSPSRSHGISFEPSSLSVVIHPDATIFDGSFSNNPWMQELPKPNSKVTWENVIWISPLNASEWKISNGDIVKLEVDGKSLEGPAWIQPGVAKNVAVVTLGYGREKAGKIGSGLGYRASSLRIPQASWVRQNVKLAKTGRSQAIATTQGHFNLDGRDIIRSVTAAELVKNPHPFRSHHGGAKEGAHGVHSSDAAPEQIRAGAQTEKKGRPFEDENYAWGMSIDLSVCNGCNACVVGCQSENNIATVGKQEVMRGRAMHWLRIDQYYSGPVENPEVYSQPVPCMHCEAAPCEVVCPVNATSHSPDGLNEMTYNRCVGTKYCSNNCPYKVRHFNFYHYSDIKTPTLKLVRNPDVTVRSRGVMEKCTFCVQRVMQAKITAKKENRVVRDGEFTTACASACPTNAIVFGNLKDDSSKVSQLKKNALNYSLLEELGTKPRTTYLAHVNNPNPKLTQPEDH